MASVITEKDSDIIIRIGTTANKDNGDILIDGNIRLPGEEDFCMYNGVTVPDGVKAKTFCYNSERGFYINRKFLYSSGENNLNITIPDVQTTVKNPKVILSDENTGDKNYTLDSIGKSLSLINDGDSPVILSINDMDIKINSEEVYSDLFEEFSSFSISTNSSYRLVVRG